MIINYFIWLIYCVISGGVVGYFSKSLYGIIVIVIVNTIIGGVLAYNRLI